MHFKLAVWLPVKACPKWHGLYVSAGDHHCLYVNRPEFPNLGLHITPIITDEHMVYI
jgi:hypothetical protein